MALVVGQNSWVTISEADDYLTDSVNAFSWFDIPSSLGPGVLSKESLLVTAYYWLTNDGRFDLPASSTNDLVKYAQIELAWWIFQHSVEFLKREALITSGVKEFEYSKWREKLGKQELPPRIVGSLSSFKCSNNVVTLGGPDYSC